MGLVARLVCGGQSGADRAGVDFALSIGLPWGGWVPHGGWAEDCTHPPGLGARYPQFIETDVDDPDVRTVLNVRDSSATLLVGLGVTISPGTERTREAVEHLSRPCCEILLSSLNASSELRAFLDSFDTEITLNVAGPRESESPGLYRATFAFFEANRDLFAVPR